MTTFDPNHLEMETKALVEIAVGWTLGSRSDLEKTLKLAASAYLAISEKQRNELEQLIVEAINLTKEKTPEIQNSNWSLDYKQEFLKVYLKILKEVVEDHNYRQGPKIKLG